MKTITRRSLRGSRLLQMCEKARIDHDYRDKGVVYCWCFGRYNASNFEALDECKACGAWTDNDVNYWEGRKTMNIEEIVKTLNMRADHHCNEYRRAKMLPREDENSIYLDGFSDGYNSAVADLQDELDELKKENKD